MPPKRVKKLIRKSDDQSFQILPNKRARLFRPNDPKGPTQPGTVQLTPILKLPTELLSEIASYYPHVPYRVFSNPECQYLPSSFCVRPDTLRALSQTCKALRHVFLPMLWERLDICTARFVASWYKQIGETMEARCELLKKRLDLAAFVHVANVCITRYHTNDILPAFASCMDVLPNLHTLQIVHAHSQMTSDFRRAFEEHSYPQIRKVIIPSVAHNILRCCPEVREVVCTEEDGSKLVTAIKAGCPKVEVLDGFNPDEPMMKRIVKAVPNLRTITLHLHTQTSITTLLAPLKKLTTINLLYIHPHHRVSEAIWSGSEQFQIKEGASDVDVADSMFVKVAREVLRKTMTGAVETSESGKSGGKAGGSGARKRAGKEKQPEAEAVDEKVEEVEISRLRIKHRKITAQPGYYSRELPDVEEWNQELYV